MRDVNTYNSQIIRLNTSPKHLAWLLSSGIIHDRLAEARAAKAFHVYSADSVGLRPSQSLRAASKGDWQTVYKTEVLASVLNLQKRHKRSRL